MPLSHLTLTVSHLPTSTSFFLSCLQPLGYRFIGRHDHSVGFGAEPGEPADFWLSEERPGVPAGAAHIAFPAPSREAVSQFFIAALKSGGKIHGEPCLRDAEQNYYSAAVIDFDGNSIEAVHRPGSSRGKPRSSDRTLSAIDNSSLVSSKASSPKSSRTVARQSSVSEVSTAKSHSPSSHKTIITDPKVTISPILNASQMQDQPKENGLNSAKAVVGTLLGAAAGAAIAYAMVKGEAQSAAANSAMQQQQHYSTSPATSSPLAQSFQEQRTIEQSPLGGLSEFARSSLAKNAKASTIFDSLDSCTRFLGPAKQPSSRSGAAHDDHVQVRRNSATGSMVYSAGSEMNIPIRAIEGIADDHDSCSECSRMYPCNPSTLISSFAERPHRRVTDGGSIYSTSTIKASKQASPSSRHSSRSSINTFEVSSSHSKKTTGSAARNIPLPASTTTTASSHRHHNSSHHSHHSTHYGSSAGSPSSHHGGHSHRSIKSYRSAHEVPLPHSIVDTSSTIFLDGVDADSLVLPEGGASRHSSRSRSKVPLSSSSHHHNHSSSHAHSSSHRRSRSSGGGRSKKSSSTTVSCKFDEPIRPCDSVSQVSSNVSKKTVKSRR